MKLAQHDHNLRVLETIDALCANSTLQAQAIMRERYHWSRSTWYAYQRLALQRLVAAQPCLEEARTKRIEQIERLVADPTCNHAAKARYLDMLAKLQGAYAPTVTHNLNVEAPLLPAAVQALLSSPSALNEALAADSAFLALPSPPTPPARSHTLQAGPTAEAARYLTLQPPEPRPFS